jgi:hypothetical protein
LNLIIYVYKTRGVNLYLVCFAVSGKYSMRIDEITINIPIKIELDNGKPNVKIAGKPVDDADESEPDQNPVVVPPLQQEIELKKAELGKHSPAIEKMLDDSDLGDDEDNKDNDIKNLRALAGLSQ